MKTLTKIYRKFFPEKEIIEIEVDELKIYNDFKENAVYADEIYKNKKLIINGYVSSVEKSFIDETLGVFVNLNKSNGFSIPKSFCCKFKKEETKNLLKLKKKQKVCILAEYDYCSSMVMFKNCKLKQRENFNNENKTRT